MGGHCTVQCTHHWIERLICQCFDASLQCIGSWSLVWVQQLIGNRWRQWQEGRHSRSCFQPWLPISTLSFTFFSLGFPPSQNTWRFVESSPNPIPNPASVAFWVASSHKTQIEEEVLLHTFYLLDRRLWWLFWPFPGLFFPRNEWYYIASCGIFWYYIVLHFIAWYSIVLHARPEQGGPFSQYKF